MDTSILLAVCWIMSAAPAAGTHSRLQAHLEQCERNYNPEHQMLAQNFNSPGYHSKVATGTRVHTTRWSLVYAGALLQRNAPGDAARAAGIIRKVLTLQDVDPNSRTYGIWPWLLEEPLEKMSPPDWNWADFCGAQLAEMLADDAAKLPRDLVQAMRASLGHAARAIRKRNVGPGYTNIAIMGGGVCAAAGELLGDPQMLQYGRDRLRKVVEHTAQHGSFAEYNSPTYTLIALWECERTLHLVRDAAAREAAESLRRTAWQIIAESFHPGTQQWAGPHSRSYSDHLSSHAVEYLAAQTGTEIRVHPAKGSGRRSGSFEVQHPLPCPGELRPRFRALPSDPLQVRRTFVRAKSAVDSTVGTTWYTAEACLGSVNCGTFWTQQRPVIGYWKTGEDPAVVFRVRFLHDGRDFASLGVSTDQQNGRALSLFYTLPNCGDWHPALDRPRDGVFHAADLRLRYELRGKGVQAVAAEKGTFVLTAGGRRAVIHTTPGRFAGQAVVWQVGRAEQCVFVDGICHQGAQRAFNFREPPDVMLAAGVELLRADEPAAGQAPSLMKTESGAVEVTWEAAHGVTLAARRARD